MYVHIKLYITFKIYKHISECVYLLSAEIKYIDIIKLIKFHYTKWEKSGKFSLKAKSTDKRALNSNNNDSKNVSIKTMTTNKKNLRITTKKNCIRIESNKYLCTNFSTLFHEEVPRDVRKYLS